MPDSNDLPKDSIRRLFSGLLIAVEIIAVIVGVLFLLLAFMLSTGGKPSDIDFAARSGAGVLAFAIMCDLFRRIVVLKRHRL